MHRARQFSQLFLGCIFKERPTQMDMEKPPASSPGILNHICVCFLASLLAVCFVVKVSQGSQNLGGLAFCAKIWEAFPS